MNFEKGYVYHVYNQGNNKRKIFFNSENYKFFLKKINDYILPYADVLAWCLMPNHFHLMVLVNDTSSQGFTQSETLTGAGTKIRTFNDSIGILLRTYTRAINKQYGMTGSLFRKETKAICINCPNTKYTTGIENHVITSFPLELTEKQYPQRCFDYIHENPVKAHLVKSTIDWEFSSARAYAGLRKGNLVNIEVAREYVDVDSGFHFPQGFTLSETLREVKPR